MKIFYIFTVFVLGFLISQTNNIKNKEQLNITFDQLLYNSYNFEKQVCSFPVGIQGANRIACIAGDDVNKKNTIVEHARNARPILHANVLSLIADFLEYKKKYGSNVEKLYYASMGIESFIDRLLIKRPLTFCGANDTYLLRDGKSAGVGSFESIGTDNEQKPLLLKDYLSYDEMQLAALIGVSTPTYFINNGNRNNEGKNGDKSSYQEEGVYVGLVGARFEKPGYMEWAHMIVTQEQNRYENGYGVKEMASPQALLLSKWAQFYGVDFFPTFDQAKNDKTGRFLKIGTVYLDTFIYKKRLEMVILPFLVDANQRGIGSNKKVYCHVVGLGTGVWALDMVNQEKLMIEVYYRILEQYYFSHISDIDFSWFATSFKFSGAINNENSATTVKNNIKIHFSKRNPADKLINENEDKLLVAMYAWDGNAYPGNEYWVKNFTESGDPAAICCSTLQELQNPLINFHISSYNALIVT